MKSSNKPRSGRVGAFEEALRALIGGLGSGAGFGAWVGSLAVRANPSLAGPSQATGFLLLCVGGYALAFAVIGVVAALVARPFGRTRSREEDGFLADFAAPIAGAITFALTQTILVALPETDALRIGVALTACFTVAVTLRALLARVGTVAAACWGAIGVVAAATPIFAWVTLRNHGAFTFESSDTAARANVKATSDPRVMLIAVDGADWERLTPLIDAGRVPNFARLCQGAFLAPLETFEPSWPPLGWTTLATGVREDVHGVLDFTELRLPLLARGVQRALPRDGVEPLLPHNCGLIPALVLCNQLGWVREIPVTAPQRRCKALWNILGEHGARVAVVRWPVTWPAEEVSGYAIADDDPLLQLFAGAKLHSGANARDACTTWPPDFTRELLQFAETDGPFTSGDAVKIGRLLEHPVLADTSVEERAVLRIDAERIEMFELLVRTDPFATRAAVHLWNDKRPPLLVVRLASIAGIERCVPSAGERAYEFVDGLLGQLLDAGGADTTFVLVSERGARVPSQPGTAPGVLVIRGADVRADAQLVQPPTLLDLAPTMLALFDLPPRSDWPGRPLSEVFTPQSLGGKTREPVAGFGAYEPSWPGFQQATQLDSQHEALQLLRKLTELGR